MDFIDVDGYRLFTHQRGITRETMEDMGYAVPVNELLLANLAEART